MTSWGVISVVGDEVKKVQDQLKREIARFQTSCSLVERKQSLLEDLQESVNISVGTMRTELNSLTDRVNGTLSEVSALREQIAEVMEAMGEFRKVIGNAVLSHNTQLEIQKDQLSSMDKRLKSVEFPKEVQTIKSQRGGEHVVMPRDVDRAKAPPPLPREETRVPSQKVQYPSTNIRVKGPDSKSATTLKDLMQMRAGTATPEEKNQSADRATPSRREQFLRTPSIASATRPHLGKSLVNQLASRSSSRKELVLNPLSTQITSQGLGFYRGERALRASWTHRRGRGVATRPLQTKSSDMSKAVEKLSLARDLKKRKEPELQTLVGRQVQGAFTRPDSQGEFNTEMAQWRNSIVAPLSNQCCQPAEISAAKRKSGPRKIRGRIWCRIPKRTKLFYKCVFHLKSYDNLQT
jgi:hypothetical protein